MPPDSWQSLIPPEKALGVQKTIHLESVALTLEAAYYI